MATVTEIKRETLNEGVIKVLEDTINYVKDAPDTSEVLVVIKTGGSYLRFSTGVKNLLELIGYLELAKHDTLTRMVED